MPWRKARPSFPSQAGHSLRFWRPAPGRRVALPLFPLGSDTLPGTMMAHHVGGFLGRNGFRPRIGCMNRCATSLRSVVQLRVGGEGAVLRANFHLQLGFSAPPASTRNIPISQSLRVL